MTEHMTAEMQIAKAYRDEGDLLRKQATAELNEARELRDQAARDRRDIAEAEAAISRRELRLAQLNETDLVSREKVAEAKLTEARNLLAQYSADGHGAAIALQQINEREKAERTEAA
jgi:hypothetical protein